MYKGLKEQILIEHPTSQPVFILVPQVKRGTIFNIQPAIRIQSICIESYQVSNVGQNPFLTR